MQNDSLKRIIKSSKDLQGIVVLDFFAEWCGPCVGLKPIFEQVANEFKQAGSPIKFYIIDVDENEHFAAQQRIKGIPAIKILHDGYEVAKLSGSQTYTELKEWIELHTKSMVNSN